MLCRRRIVSEGKLSEFSARTILDVICARENTVLLSAKTGTASYNVVAGNGGVRFADRGELKGEAALFLLLMETEGTFALNPVPAGLGPNCMFASLHDVDERFAAWRKRLDGGSRRFLDPGLLYWWRSRLSKDVAQLPRAEYDITQLIRDRALNIDVLTSVLGADILDVCRILKSMAQYPSFEEVLFVRPQRRSPYHCIVASRDAVLSNVFWQHVCGGETPLLWDSRTLLYARSVAHPVYDLDLVVLTQVLDEAMKELIERADMMIFLLGGLPLDEEKYVQELRELNPAMTVFFWGTQRRSWTRHVPQSVFFQTPLERDAVLQALDVFL